MRIGIDARFFGSIGKGLGRYTQKLIENLEKIDQHNQYFVFLRKENFDHYQPKNKNFQKVLADYRWYTFSEQVRFPRLLRKFKLDLLHFPHFNVPLLYFGRFVVTIHDLILIHFPTVRSSTLSPFSYWLKFLAYKITIWSAILRSSRIIAVSKFTKKDILNNYPRIPQEKIRVTYEAAEDYCMLTPGKDEQILKGYGLKKPYLMYVGNAYPHKNLERLVRAFRIVREKIPEVSLIFIGKEDYFYSRIKELVKKEKVEGVSFLGFVPDYNLDTIFHNTTAYIMPSLYEGFGLPPLEAMSKGAPVVASDHECIKEILEESACYFDAKSEKDMTEAILRVVQDKSLQKKLIEKGYLQIAKFSWIRMARLTLKIYQEIENKK
jgi:glycosyltransferase involved in cell wall biosynthesis